MTRFLLKGLLRDRHRSLFPIVVVTIGAALTVVMTCLMHGFMDEAVRSYAQLDTGHVKVVTRGYRELVSQLPNDLAIDSADSLIASLRREYPDLEWTARIKFGGLLDVPDSLGETRSQGPVFGIAADLLGANTREPGRLNLGASLVRGRLPERPGEILVSDDLARQLEVAIGETATLVGATSTGAMAIHNFLVAGTVRFGVAALDRNSMIVDLGDAQYALDMSGMAGEILGFFPNTVFDANRAEAVAAAFNAAARKPEGDPAADRTPVMITLRDQNGLGALLDLAEYRITIILAIFFVVMSIVLWNAGLMSGIRRYGEFGVRLAIGESKGHVFATQLVEAALIGLVGATLGTAIGLGASWYLQEVGIDMSGMMESSSVLMASVVRAQVTRLGWFIGFLPGLGATLVGTAVSGIGVFRRQTAQLFKELET